jgi:DNA-binding beta-propeller fold protein YncE
MKSPDAALIFQMTDGRSKYRMIRPWQKPSDEGSIGVISQLAVDSRGRVFVLQRNSPHLLVFGRDGTLERTFDHPRLTTGHGIVIDNQDRIFAVSYDAHQVLVFDRDFELVMELGTFNEPCWGAPFNHPTDVAVAPDGEIYVSDGYGNARVHRFSSSGNLISSWGEVGRGPGQFSTPHGISVLSDSRVAVCDRDNDRIQLFDREGRFVDEWRDILRPMDIWASGDNVFITEQAPRITRLDLNGKVQGRFRTFGVYPHGLSGDAEGNLFVAEQGSSHCVTKYERVGAA